MNREELKNILPHREPMLLLDEAELTEEGEAMAATGSRATNSSCRGTSRICR